MADVAEVWRQSSVIASWLLHLTAIALLTSRNLEEFGGRVSDSGEGRWSAITYIYRAVWKERFLRQVRHWQNCVKRGKGAGGRGQGAGGREQGSREQGAGGGKVVVKSRKLNNLFLGVPIN